MIKRAIFALVLVACFAVGGSASAYDFWGIKLGTESYQGSTQLTFDGLNGSGIQYAVGGYKYTRVDSTWYGTFAAASPGEGFLASRKSDAQGLFFKADASAAHFMVIAGTLQAGYAAPEVGTGSRIFGPGDLKLDMGGYTLGVGMRLDNLLWAIDPATTNPECLIYRAGGGVEDIHARDAGNLGDVELDPTWARMGHSTLSSSSDMATAFFESGTGSLVGSAAVTCQNTGISLYGAGVYAYEVTVPWAVLGQDATGYDFRASWRPDCGNDAISADFSSSQMMVPVPEPGAIVSMVSGLAGLVVYRKRK